MELVTTNLVKNIYKPVGKTPLEIVNEFIRQHPRYKNNKIGYAGRLDPMAEGVLVLLIEPETKKRALYQNLGKTYVFDVLFGIKTDSYDMLGLPTLIKQGITIDRIKKCINTFPRQYVQPFPPYSSKTVHGKPLYWWARNNKLHTISTPQKEVIIYSLKLVKTYEIFAEQLYSKVEQIISSVEGDFRQKQIHKAWLDLLKSHPQTMFTVATLEIECSSGTYVRSIAHELGNKLNTGAIALSIKRTSVGNFSIKDSLILF